MTKGQKVYKINLKLQLSTGEYTKMSVIFDEKKAEKEKFEPARVNIIIIRCEDIITASRIGKTKEKDFGGKIYFD